MVTSEKDVMSGRRGRPRSRTADDAILGATIEVLAETGLARFSVEAVAARAVVGKTTIYRRWPSAESLIVAAIERLADDLVVPDTGDTRGDLRADLDEEIATDVVLGPLNYRFLIGGGRLDRRALEAFADAALSGRGSA